MGLFGFKGWAMKSHRILFAFLILLAICSCGMPYSRSNTSFWRWSNNGYSEVQLDSITYQVTYEYPTAGEAERFALYRAAEVTNQHGFDYFVVTDSRATDASVIKTIRMYQGNEPSDNPSAYNANSMLTVMGPKINQ